MYKINFLAFHAWRNSNVAANDEPASVFYARIWSKQKDLDDPDRKVIRYKVGLGSIEKDDITEKVREHHIGKQDENFDKYSDPDYIRKRLNISKGSHADEKLDLDVAGVYLRKLDKNNSFGRN